MPFWKTIGVKWLLSRAGASLQDLNSLPYRELKDKLTAMFAKHGAPMLWAGGHDHALQVIRNTEPTQPQWAIVSGAASKCPSRPTDGSRSSSSPATSRRGEENGNIACSGLRELMSWMQYSAPPPGRSA